MADTDAPTNQYLVEVIVPLRIGWTPVYRSQRKLSRGECVSVVFSGRQYFGVVLSENISQSEIKKGTSVLDILPESPLLPKVSEKELKLWEFMADYYMCSLGEVYRTARPLLLLKAEKAMSGKIENLKSRLSETENDLGKKHRSNGVIERLNAKRKALTEELSSLTKYYLPLEESRAREVALKPTLLKGSDRYGYYASAVKNALEHGGQVLVLAPDIFTCNRLKEYLRPLLGETEVEVFTPDTTPTGRAMLSSLLRRGRSLVVIGTKASVFLPFKNLALVITDEEQDELYKQHDTAPRYNGRDASVALSKIHSAKAVLGSSCPSFESLYNCLSGKYTMEVLPHRPLGQIGVIDTKAEQKKRGFDGEIFSKKLISEISACKDSDIILIRGWGKKDILESEMERLFPNKENVRIMTLRELRQEEADVRVSLIAVLQADALVSSEDFRSDEKAFRIVSLLRERAQRVVLQTSVPTRFNGSRSPEELLSERRQFSFPPYTRLIEVKETGSDRILSQHFLKHGGSLGAEKKAIREALPKGAYADVDPL